MCFLSELSRSQEYLSFRSNIPLRKIVVDSDSSKGWKIYDSGPKSVKSPLICLPPVSGTADVFFKQVLYLHAKGIRIISAEHPVYWTPTEWCEGFRKLLDCLGLSKVHIFGSSLGGFLAQKFAESTAYPQVASLILCNAFADTSVFSYTDSSSMYVYDHGTSNHFVRAIFWMLPSLFLKKVIMGNLSTNNSDPTINEAVEFMVERLESLSQQDLASRLTINCASSYVEPQKFNGCPVTIMDVFDEYALAQPVREEMYKLYPNAKLAHLKSGGNFPYLSRGDEVNLHLQIHLRDFKGTAASPFDE